MKVSVALCTFEGERFLAQQLASIAEQTRPPDELVIRDDASTDGTARIVEAFARDFPGVVDFAVHPRRLGVRGNFESALAATTGDLVLLCDQDDVWRPSRVARAVRAFEAEPDLQLLFTDARLVDAAGRPLGRTLFQGLGVCADEFAGLREGRAFEVLLRRSLALGATSCLRRSVLADALPIPAAWMHDAWVAQIAAARGAVVCDPEPTIDYRQHGANVEGGPPLSLQAFWRSVFALRRDFRAPMLDRTASLAQRLREIGAPAACTALVEAKLPHVRFRGSLPRWRPLRVVPVLREAWTGRYARFSTGWRAILIDLLGPVSTPAGPAPIGDATTARGNAEAVGAGAPPGGPRLQDLAQAVRRNCADYLREREHWSPRLNSSEREAGRRWRNLATFALGLAQTPVRPRTDTLNVFHTSRHAAYMKAFEPHTVLLVGGAAERDLARREGYRFVWSYGATGAVNLAVHRGWTVPLVLALAAWRRLLSRPSRVTVFLFEDTLQHGSFLVHAARGLRNGARSVCIAHGYYPALDVPLRIEGSLCDWNFVWDARQAALLAGAATRTVVTGLPHDARAQPGPVRTLVLVGVGHPDFEASVHARALACYARIAAIATRRHGLAVVYRPHPAERADAGLVDDLRRRFGMLDELPLNDRLSGPRAVFVGFVSSLLHEAGVAGHPVVHVDGHPGLRALFHRDLSLQPESVDAIDGWLTRLLAADASATPPSADVSDGQRPCVEPTVGAPGGVDAPPQAEGLDALGRFRRALACLD